MGLHLKGGLLPMFANIRLGPTIATNALAYNTAVSITTMKTFIVKAPRACVVESFTAINTTTIYTRKCAPL